MPPNLCEGPVEFTIQGTMTDGQSNNTLLLVEPLPNNKTEKFPTKVKYAI